MALTLHSHTPDIRAILQWHVQRLGIWGCCGGWWGLRSSHSSSDDGDASSKWSHSPTLWLCINVHAQNSMLKVFRFKRRHIPFPPDFFWIQHHTFNAAMDIAPCSFHAPKTPNEDVLAFLGQAHMLRPVIAAPG